MNEDLARRHSRLISSIGMARLTALPEEVKEVLKTTTDLKVKVEMLELIDAELKKEARA